MAKSKIFTKKNLPLIIGSAIAGAGLLYIIDKKFLKNRALLSDTLNPSFDPYFGRKDYYSTPLALPEADKSKEQPKLNPDDFKMKEPPVLDPEIIGVNR